MGSDCLLCRLLRQIWVLIVLGLLLLVLLWLGRGWLWTLLLFYLAILLLAGLLALALVARRIFRKLCSKWSSGPKGGGSEGHPGGGPVYVPPTIYKRPDPLIYSQAWLSARGLAVTWDNPDISLFEVKPDGVVPAQAHALEPDRPHLIRARIWNGSFEAPAVNLLVRFSYLSFGIGTVKTLIGEALVDLPVKGSASLPCVAEMAWLTPAAGGHYCVQVELIWADDADPGNNLGQTNLDVKKLNSPNASFVFQLRNDGVAAARLRLTTDAYRLAPPDPCERETDPRRRNQRIAGHLRDAHGLPPGWRVEIGDEAGETLRPGAERPVAVKVVAPDGFAGELDINVNAFDGERLVGGVTLRVHS